MLPPDQRDEHYLPAYLPTYLPVYLCTVNKYSLMCCYMTAFVAVRTNVWGAIRVAHLTGKSSIISVCVCGEREREKDGVGGRRKEGEWSLMND